MQLLETTAPDEVWTARAFMYADASDVLEGATAGLLGRGALDGALRRIERELPCRELVAA